MESQPQQGQHCYCYHDVDEDGGHASNQQHEDNSHQDRDGDRDEDERGILEEGSHGSTRGPNCVANLALDRVGGGKAGRISSLVRYVILTEES